MRFAAGIALLCFLFLSISALNDFGLLGPDEPRYVSIGRDMARTGDWITPRLWGEPWFEKPALLYWMVAVGHVAGLPGEWAARLPVALLSAAFLILFWWLVDEQAGPRAAWMSTTILATSAGWTAFSRLAVTDLPLSACFAAGMLLSAGWAQSGSQRRLPLAGLCFGLALLAKGPLAGVLALPLIWETRRRWRDWWRVAFPALLVAAPWYALCAARNGSAFVNDFFLKHNLGRFASAELQHVQPFWFYVPVLLLGFFPWTPLVAVLRRPANPWERLLWLWLGFGFLFFSLSVNKLPGYLLPLFPAAALLGVHLDRAVESRRVLVAAAGFLGLLPAVAAILPDALVTGVRRASAGAQLAPALPWMLAFAVTVWIAHKWKGLPAAFATTALLCCAAVGYLQHVAAPALDARVSARRLGPQSCIGNVNRTMRYGLNHYAGRALPDCQPPRMVQ